MSLFKIQTLNSIAVVGLDRLPRDRYEVASAIAEPDAILLRSFKMHDMAIPDSVLCVGRAGAGTNNIPVAKLGKRGVPVFNTPGANANAVKELVIAGLLMAARNLPQAWAFARSLKGSGEELDKAVEAGKKEFVGFELPKRTLGVVGLGAIGVEVANAALELGMQVLGYDPTITVQHAWELSSGVQKAVNLDDLFARSDVVTVHVPLTKETDKLVNAARLQSMRRGVGAVELLARRDRRLRGRHCGARRGQAARVRHGLPEARAARSSEGDLLPAPRRVDRRGRGELRRDGRRQRARVPRERQRDALGELSRDGAPAHAASPRRDSARERAEHGRADPDGLAAQNINIADMLNHSRDELLVHARRPRRAAERSDARAHPRDRRHSRGARAADHRVVRAAPRNGPLRSP